MPGAVYATYARMLSKLALPSALSDIVREKSILVCAGAGGVGKTTTAAALALQGAKMGRKTLVLTIDPARRLASSLGLEAISHQQAAVPDAMLRSVGVESGKLWAMMLDQKQAFDDVLERSCRDPKVRERILRNKIYRQISSALTGSHEYAAMATLCDIDRQGDYELVVVDTPPTSHALDFLDAPQKIIKAVDSPAVKWFAQSNSGRFSLKIMGLGGAFVVKRVARFVGSDFLEDMGRFFSEAKDVLAGFRDRAREVQVLFRQPKVGFVVVTAPESESIEESLLFHRRLKSGGLPFSGFVVNRVHALDPEPVASADELAQVFQEHSACAELSPYEVRRGAGAVAASHHDFQVLARANREQIARLLGAIGQSDPLAEVPFFERDVHDVQALARVGDYLVR